MKTKIILGITTFLISVILTFPIDTALAESLLIIAPDEFIDELQPLKTFKDATARPTILLSLSQVYQNYTGSDEPEQIKQCIADYEKKYNIKFVLLVGDCDKLPVRYCKAYHTEWGSKYYPSDLYYSDLYNDVGGFDDWDGDNDGIIGEMDFAGGTDIAKVNLDTINMYPDVAVARVPASNETEVTTYVNKVIDYEINTSGNWFDNAYLVVGDWEGDVGETKMDGIMTYLSDFIIHKRYMLQPPWNAMTADQRSDEMNNFLNSGTGLVLYHGHGKQDQWSEWYYQSKMGDLTNSNMLPVMFANACYTGRFHFNLEYYLDVNGVEWDKRGQDGPFDRPEPMPVQPSKYDTYENESLAEHFLVKRNTGAIGYVGNTSKGEFGSWLSTTEGLAPYFCEGYSQGTRTLGGLWRKALVKFAEDVEQIGMHYYAYSHIHKMMLFGDPSLVVGGGVTYATRLCVIVYDGNGGPLSGRFYTTCDITVPIGQRLRVQPSALVEFESGRKITALDTHPNNGLRVNAELNKPIGLFTLSADPHADHQGMIVRGQMRVRNGGGIKFF